MMDWFVMVICTFMAIHIRIYQKPDNGSVAAVIEQYPDQFLGWAALNPMIPGSLEEIEFYLNQPGFIGVKAHPFMHEYPYAGACSSCSAV